jgi:hypothetical protein
MVVVPKMQYQEVLVCWAQQMILFIFSIKLVGGKILTHGITDYLSVLSKYRNKALGNTMINNCGSALLPSG